MLVRLYQYFIHRFVDNVEPLDLSSCNDAKYRSRISSRIACLNCNNTKEYSVEYSKTFITKSANSCISGNAWVSEALFVGLKRPGSEADHSPPSNSKVENAWRYNSNLKYVFMAWCLVNTRVNYHLHFTRLQRYCHVIVALVIYYGTSRSLNLTCFTKIS
jgi:hypothetical protein